MKTTSALKKIICILSFPVIQFDLFGQNVSDSIHRLFRGVPDGDEIRKEFAYFETPGIAANNKGSKDNNIVLGIFHSNKLFLQTGPHNSRIPYELKDISNGSPRIPEAINRGIIAGQATVLLFDSVPLIATACGINHLNSSGYEFRVLHNRKDEMIHWRPVTMFCESYLLRYNADSSQQTEIGYLGEFKAAFGNSVTIQVREKTDTFHFIALSAVWLNISPTVMATFSNYEMPAFLSVFKQQWRRDFMPDGTYDGDLESALADSLLVKRKDFKPTENSIIFYLSNKIKSKEIIEYNLVTGKRETGWKPNDFDLNLIWLKDLSPGKYTLQMRYSLQRQNISEYEFRILPAWYQTLAYKIIAGILGLIVLSSILLVFKSQNQKRKIKWEQLQKQQTQAELKSIRSQFNPHFVFNALSSIQGLITKNDMNAANKYLSEFSSLLRDSLKESANELTSLSTEIKMLDSYLKLEQLRFGFVYTISTGPTIDLNAVEVPALLFQPLVENAVKHGISSLYDKGKLTIDFKRSFSDMLVTIADNGKGFHTDEKIGGYGLKLTNDRIELLNKTLKGQSIEFSTSSSAQGTRVQMIFKNWLL